MEYQTLTLDSPDYPQLLRQRLGEHAPSHLYYRGAFSNLERFTVAVISGMEAGGTAWMETNQLLFTMRDYNINYIGASHSFMEHEIMRLGLYFAHNAVSLFSAKGLAKDDYDSFLYDRFRPPMHKFPERNEYFRRAEAGELLMLSVAEPDLGRTLKKNVLMRNLVACALADAVLIPYAERGSKTLKVAKQVVELGIPAFTIDVDDSRPLFEIGVKAFKRSTVGAFLDALGAKRAEQAKPASANTYKRVIPQDSIPIKHNPPAPEQIKLL